MGSNFLTQRQQSILVGSLLGDTTLEVQGRNTRARFDHSIAQKDYLLWKYEELKNLASSEPRLVHQTKHWKTGKIYSNWHFSTRTISELNEWRRLFYQDKRKIIPVKIKVLLRDSLALAVWIMDDGYKRNDCDAVRISTEAFDLGEQNRLIDCLEQNFGLKATIHRKSRWYNIYIPQSEMLRLRKLTEQYIISSMRYKICPVTTDSLLICREEIVLNIQDYKTPTPKTNKSNLLW